jgi:YgiT-type zinc finger domain-containing protein
LTSKGESVPQVHHFRAPELGWIKERVLSGQYHISEHIIRWLTSGMLCLAEIETALLHGRITEERKGRHDRESCLVEGCVEEKSLSILCTRTDDERLMIVLVYMQTPAWQGLGGTQSTEKNKMPDDKPRKCFFCNGTIKPIVMGNFDYRLEGDLYVIKNVPAGLCLECGEKYITAPVAQKINTLVTAGNIEGTEVVRVLPYPGG